MKTIRKSVFETNSSSSHSVTISYGGPLHASLDENKVLSIFPGEFGWEEQTYDSFEDKASYAYTYAINYDKEKMPLLEEVLLEYSKASKIIFEKDRSYYPYGYIDHESIDEASSIFNSKEDLRDFLFCEQSYFMTDNDNH